MCRCRSSHGNRLHAWKETRPVSVPPVVHPPLFAVHHAVVTGSFLAGAQLRSDAMLAQLARTAG